MKDRIPRYPGRITLIPVPGQVNTYDLIMADDPIEDGTPPTKGNLLADGTAATLGLETATVNLALEKIVGSGLQTTFQRLVTGRFI